MKKKMNIIFTLPGIEICIMLLLSLFMPLVSYNSGSYKLYNGITILSYSSIDLSKEYVNALNSLRNFVIVTLLLLFIMAITFLVIGLANKQFMAGAVISIISSVCILIMEMFAYISITGVRDKGISVKFGFLFILLSTIGILVYDIVMGCIKSENEIQKNVYDNNSVSSDFNGNGYEENIQQQYGYYDNDIQQGAFENKPDAILVPPTVYGTTLKGMILGTEGTFKGASLQLSPGESIVVGRDPGQCNLVLSSPKVSRKHCTIFMDVSGTFISIICYSKNGIRFEDGKIIRDGETIKLTQKEKLIIADGSEILEIL